MNEVLFDLSRTFFRAAASTPTGIDRVELAYARHFLSHERFKTRYVISRFGQLVQMPDQTMQRLIGSVGARWQGPSVDETSAPPAAAVLRGRGAERTPAPVRAAPLGLWLDMLPTVAAWRGRRADGRSTYIKISHQGLENPLRYRRLKKRAGSRFVVFLHDLIPIRFPEYARPGAAARHRQRVRTIASLADLVVVNSASTARDFADYCQAHRLRQPETATVELAVEPAFMERTAIASNAENYFVCVGTIEPRKNHLLLLNIWRDMILRHGTAAPKLVLIGRRGWENENIFDMLNRCAAFPGHVMWLRTASDEDIRRSLRGARALLMPSFAEGFGLPVAEALALGVPVLSSDLPSLREAGQGVPDYLDPLDGLGWMRAIMDYAAEPSPARIAQLQRLDRFRPISWSDHFSAFERLAFSA